MKDTHEAEVVWQSTDDNPKSVTPNGDPFMTIKKARGYYYFAERGGIDSIAFILYNNDTQQIGLIYESKPPMDEKYDEKHMGTTAFGGSIDMAGKTPFEICQVEVLEESGYDVPMDKIFSVGETMVSTQMNQTVHGFFVDVTGITPGKTEADIHNDAQDEKDPDEFIHNKVVWATANEVMKNGDWKSIWIYSLMYFSSLAIKNQGN